MVVALKRNVSLFLPIHKVTVLACTTCCRIETLDLIAPAPDIGPESQFPSVFPEDDNNQYELNLESTQFQLESTPVEHTSKKRLRQESQWKQKKGSRIEILVMPMLPPEEKKCLVRILMQSMFVDAKEATNVVTLL
jgi:hypothetical protein